MSSRWILLCLIYLLGYIHTILTGNMVFKPRPGKLVGSCSENLADFEMLSLRQLQKLVYSDKARLVVCDLPYSGSMQLFDQLISLVEDDRSRRDKDSHHLLLKAMKHGSDYQMHYQANKQLLLNTMGTRLDFYTKVLVHRHPLERLVAMFVKKRGFSRVTQHSSDELAAINSYVQLNHQTQRARDPDGHNIVNKTDMNIWTGGLSFRQFVKFVLHSGCAALYPWLSMHDTCLPCILGYDHLIRWENIENETRSLITSLRMGAQLVDSPMYNDYNFSDMEWKKFYDSVDATDIQALLDMYRIDMQLFNYTWAPP